MSEFTVKKNGVRQNIQDERAILSEMHKIEQDIEKIISELNINYAAMSRIKNDLRNKIQKVSASRDKLQVMANALEEIEKLYETTENKIAQNGANGENRIKEFLSDIETRIRETANRLGIRSAGVYAGDPVNLCNGNYIFEKRFLEIETASDLHFGVFYNIQLNESGALGRGWLHNYEMSLKNKESIIIITDIDGSTYEFRINGEEYKALPGVFGKLKRTASQYSFTNRENIEFIFDKSGHLIEKKDMAGNQLTFEYDEMWNLVTVKDNYGDKLNYEYDENGYMMRVSGGKNKEIILSYHNDIVSKVTDVLGRTMAFEYNENGWLINIINGKSVSILKNSFDDKARTIKQQFADGGVIEYEYIDEFGQIIMTEQNGNKIVYEHDELCRNTRNIYENGEENFSYNENNMRTSFTDRRGYTSNYKYDESGNMIAYKNPLNDEVIISYNDNSQIESVSLNGDVLYKSIYENGVQTKLEDITGAVEVFEYNTDSQPVIWTKADGSKVYISYDDYGNMTEISNSMGGCTRYEYDDMHRVIRSYDAYNNMTEYEYNYADIITKVKNADGSIRTYEYDECGNLSRLVDFNGGIISISYNDMNKPVKVVDADGNITRYEYDIMNNVVKKIDAEGGVTAYEYNRFNHLTKVTDANGYSNIMEYDACGNMIKRIDSNGAVYQLGYDGLNRPNEIIEPNGNVIKSRYDALGNVILVEYGDGINERYEYDKLGKMISSVNRGGYKQRYSYDIMGNLKRIEDEDGIIEEYEYYAGGLVKSETHEDGTYRIFRYDLNENLISITNQDNNKHEFEYDCMGRVIRVIENGEEVEKYEYDAVGNVISITDAVGVKMSYQYNYGGKVTAVVDGNGNETRYEYDKCLRLIKILQPENGHFDADLINKFNEEQRNIRVTAYIRDKVGNIVETYDTEENKVAFSYDGCGNILSKTDSDGFVTRCIYNPDGTEKECIFADGRSIKYEYNALKQLIQMEDWLGITKINVDNMGNVEKVIMPNGDTVSYEWGKAGERKSVQYPNGEKVRYEYDSAKRLVSMDNGKCITKYHYGQNGKLLKKQFSNGIVTEYAYNKLGKINEICHRHNDRIIDRFLYSYDKLGRKERVDKYREGIEDSVYEYSYNKSGSLVNVKIDGNTKEQYEYDIFGNRVESYVRGKNVKYSYNRLNQLISTEEDGKIYEFAYDRRGNLSEVKSGNDVIGVYEFNELNMITNITMADISNVYEYNGFGQRVRERSCIDGEYRDITYTYDLTRNYHNVLELIQNGNRCNLLWDSEIMGIESEKNIDIFLNDELMTPQRVISEGKIVNTFRYDTFGNAIENDSIAAGMVTFTGYQSECIQGLLYAGRREYEPKYGRFISKDPYPGMITMPITLNLYAYCIGDPLNNNDPTGEIIGWLAGGIVGAVVNVATKAAGDVVTSIKNRKLTVSSWQSYVGTAAGGFTSGTVLMTTGNMAVAGAAGSAVESFTTGGLSMLTQAEGYRQEDGYSWKNLVADTAKSSFEGAVTGFVFGDAKYLKIQGITAGRGSYQAVWKQVVTKYNRGLIKNISLKTMGKGIVAYGEVRFFDQIINKGISEIEDYAKEKGEKCLRNIFDWITDNTIVPSVAYMAGGVSYRMCSV